MHKQLRLITIVGIFSLLFGGCDNQPVSPYQTETRIQPKPFNQQTKPLTSPPEVTSETEEGFHDLLFYIEDHKQLSDGSQILRVRGTQKLRQLGFEVILSPAWKSGFLDKSIPLVTYRGIVSYRSIGSDSDSFIEILDELYETKLNSKAMRKEIKFTGISLEGDPRDLSKGPVKIKLFFESEKEDEYAELFTNIDLSARRLEFHEKDPDYRLPVVKALSEH